MRMDSITTENQSITTSCSKSDLICRTQERHGFRKAVRRVAETLSITKTLKNSMREKQDILSSSEIDGSSSKPLLIYTNDSEVKSVKEVDERRMTVIKESSYATDKEVSSPSSNQDKQLEKQNVAQGEYFLCRVYKKVSGSNAVALFLPSRDFTVTEKGILTVEGVFTTNEAEIGNKTVFLQITLTFRYGRDDEEVMGLRLSNESLLCLEQVHPLDTTKPSIVTQSYSSTQSLLIQKLGNTAKAFRVSIVKKLPPSVRLLPAKEYKGAAIGINYDIRVYAVDKPEDIPSRRHVVKMGIRVIQEVPRNLDSMALPEAIIDKNMQLLADGKINLEAKLDKSSYHPSDKVIVSLQIVNNSGRSVKKIKASVIQHVDVSMFSNGKFKNVVASTETPDNPFSSNRQALEFQLVIVHNSAKQWVALEERYGIADPQLAASTFRSDAHERNYFAIYVDYYVKVTILTSGVGSRELSVKLPFILLREDPMEQAQTTIETAHETIAFPSTSTKNLDKETKAPDGKESDTSIKDK